MKRLLNTTTAISMAFATIPPLPGYAQTMLNIEGQAVLCLAARADECPEGQLCVVAKKPENCERFAKQAVRALNQGLIPATGVVDLDAAKAALAAVQAEADAAAQAAADAAAAAEAAAAAGADAAAQAAADAAAQAAADAAAKAEAVAAKAAAKAEKAAAKAAADAAAQAESDAAQAEADAAAQAEADAAKAAAKAEKAAAKAAAAAAAQAESDAAAQAEADAAAKAEADAAAAAAETRTAEDLAAMEAAEAAAQAALDAAAADEAADPASFPTITVDGQNVICLPSKAAVCPEGEFCVVAKIQDNCEANATKALARAEPVATPVPTDDALTGLDDALDTRPDQTTPVAEAGDNLDSPDANVDPDTQVTEEVITEDDVRASTEEFDAAPTVVAPGKKSGLSDLEKVGLIALGALAVGAIINSNKEVVSNSGDRVVVRQPDGSYIIYKDDDALLRQPGTKVRTETYRDGSTRTIVTRADGAQIITVRDATGRVLRRVAYDRQGREYVLINDMQAEIPVVVSQLPRPTGGQITTSTRGDDAALQLRLAALEIDKLGRKFSLRQVREISEVRALAATIAVDNITFDTGSAAINATEAEKLTQIGALMTDLIRLNPNEIFLIEGHTDAVGSGASNLALSDRRAESVAKALTEYFDVPPENLVVQGYGETDLRIETEGDERANRRAAVRIITPLLSIAAAN